MSSAVPDVQTTATGSPVCWASPRAMNAALRSSTTTWRSMPSRRASATIIGALREPGDMTKCLMPCAIRTSTRMLHCFLAVDSI